MAVPDRTRRRLIHAAQLLTLFAAYVASAKLALAVAPEYPWSTLFWTPVGVGLAALVMGGLRLSPGIAISTFVVATWLMGRPPGTAAALALSHTAACLAGALVLRRIPSFHRSLDRLRDLLVILLLAGTVTSLVDTAGGTAVYALGGIIPAAQLGEAFGGWLSGAFVAIFVVAPVLMTWLARPPTWPRPAALAEAAALAASLLVYTALVFSQRPAEAIAHPLLQPYVLIFPLIWAAVRFGVRGSSAAALAVAVVAAYATYTGHGAFARTPRLDSLTALHVYLASTAGAALALGAVAYERVRTERELAAIVACSTDAIIGRALDGTITSWNAAATRLYGFMPEEVIGQPIAKLIPPEVRAEADRLFARLDRGEPVEIQETVRLRKDGTRVEVWVAWSPVRDRAGAVAGTSAIMRDLGESAERWRLACDAARVGMWSWCIGDNRLNTTRLCRSIHGLGPDEELTAERWFASLHPEDRASAMAAVERSVATRDGYRIEYRIVWPDGSVHWVFARGRFYAGDAGGAEEHPRIIGVMLDITARKRAEQERAELLEREQAALAEARDATRAKDEFLAMVSHELRTPLQAMLGWTNVLRSRRGDEALMQKALAGLERNVRSQTQLVEDLLDVSRIVAGKLRVDRVRVDLAKVVEAALDATRAAAQNKLIRLEAAVTPGVGDVLGDADRLQQVVSNLITNAVKFTPEGGWVRVRLEREGATARIVVSDEGRGIHADLLPHVFERFRQAEGGATRRHGGLGLGLAIVRHLVEEHGGTVRAESPGEGRGATFTVTLPLLPPQPPAVVAMAIPSEHGEHA